MRDANQYINENKINQECEDSVILYIKKNIKTNSFGIDWGAMTESILVENIQENQFVEKLKQVLSSLNSSIEDTYYIINSDDAVPPLQSRIGRWIPYCADILYPDTVFLKSNGKNIIHFDFYGNLHGKLIYSDFLGKV